MRKITLLTGKKSLLPSSISTFCLCTFFLFSVAFTACSKDDDDGAPTPPPIDNLEPPTPPAPDPESTEGNLDGWNWEGENSDKGLIDAVQ